MTSVERTWWRRYRSSAARRGIRWRLSLPQMLAAYTGVCALSGEKLVWPASLREWRAGLQTASLDRIDSSKGYYPGNVQWVHKAMNKLKGGLPEPLLLEWAARIVRHARDRTPQTSR